MKALRKYRITIEDESRLRQIASVSVRPYALWAAGAVMLLLFLLLAAIIIMVTPLRTLLPGYLKHGERTAAEQGLLRLDSIRDSYSVNSQYLENILTVLNTDRMPTDSVQKTYTPNELPPDSLLPASPREREFINEMKDREKYNVTVLAPIAGEQLHIYPVADGAVISEQSRNSVKVKILTPKGSPACALSDGRVLAVQNISPEGGASIVMQHDNGFATRYSHVGTPAVTPGAHVDGGSVIAHGATGGSLSPGYFFIEMWYDGSPIQPDKYLQGNAKKSAEEPYTLSGMPMGR